MERATDTTDYLSTPASKDSEESLLGSILLEPTLLTAEVINRVEPKDFQTRKYGWVWEAFIALQKNGTGIDQLTVQEHLERQGEHFERREAPFTCSYTYLHVFSSYFDVM